MDLLRPDSREQTGCSTAFISDTNHQLLAISKCRILHSNYSVLILSDKYVLFVTYRCCSAVRAGRSAQWAMLM